MRFLACLLVTAMVAMDFGACASISPEPVSPEPAVPAEAAREVYADDPAIVARLEALGARTGLMLGKFKVLPADAGKYHSALKNGPGRRDFCNKMAYAADRGTAFYCGANHQSPHRLNDVWEFHLGSNTWHLVCPPGLNAAALRSWTNKAKKARDAIKKGKDVQKNTEFLEGPYADYCKKWWSGATVEGGYLQDRKNGGPVQPWHTWDGLAYDRHTGRLCWAVLDAYHTGMVKNYARATGQDAEKLAAQVEPASTMYMYDPVKARWFRQLGQEPFPRMHGMGGSLVYLPDVRTTIWYCAAQNRTPNDFGMWVYDAGTNTWKELMSFGTVRSLALSKKVAPGSELQAAYSPKHGKIVAVLKKDTFVYDVAANTWQKKASTPGYGHDAHSIFAYDSTADVFLLVSRSKQWAKGEPWRLHAYDLKTDAWETVKIQGQGLPDDSKRPAWRAYKFAGYYDEGHNALVLYEGRDVRTWVYRHSR